MLIHKALLENCLLKIINSAYVPAIAYAFVEPDSDNVSDFSSIALAVGEKKALSSDQSTNNVNEHTIFPASSLSKIVFTYLVLQLVKQHKFDLDEPLYNTLRYKRFLVSHQFPEKSRQLTARHVLSHTSGLPNFGSSLLSHLKFDAGTELGEGYAYSGEAFLYLQKAIEKKFGKNLEKLAQEYIFKPLNMQRTTFLPPSKDETNIVMVHTQFKKPRAIYKCTPHLNAAASLLTTAHDFSKFMQAWLKQIENPIIRQSFEPRHSEGFMVCGLGWHVYRNKDEPIAYQFGANPNTQSFIAINIKSKKATVFFTNSDNGMAIANQVLGASGVIPIGNIKAICEHLNYKQCDELGWQKTLEAKIAEDCGAFETAQTYLAEALRLSPEDKSKQRRLEWFQVARKCDLNKKIYVNPIGSFMGTYKNHYNDMVDFYIDKETLIYKQFDQSIELVRVSEDSFLPKKNQSFKVDFKDNKIKLVFVEGYEKVLSKCPTLNSKYSITLFQKPVKSETDEHNASFQRYGPR